MSRWTGLLACLLQMGNDGVAVRGTCPVSWSGTYIPQYVPEENERQKQRKIKKEAGRWRVWCTGCMVGGRTLYLTYLCVCFVLISLKVTQVQMPPSPIHLSIHTRRHLPAYLTYLVEILEAHLHTLKAKSLWGPPRSCTQELSCRVTSRHVTARQVV